MLNPIDRYNRLHILTSISLKKNGKIYTDDEKGQFIYNEFIKLERFKDTKYEKSVFTSMKDWITKNSNFPLGQKIQ